MTPEYEQKESEHAVTFVVKGKLSSTNAEEFDQQIKGLAADPGNRAVILDFSEVTLLTSAPLRTLVAVGNLLKKSQIRFLIAASSEAASEAIRFGGYLKLKRWEMCATVEEALALAAEPKKVPARSMSSTSPPPRQPATESPKRPPSALPTRVSVPATKAADVAPVSSTRSEQSKPQEARSTETARQVIEHPRRLGLIGRLWNVVRYYTRSVPIVGNIVEAVTWWSLKIGGKL